MQRFTKMATFTALMGVATTSASAQNLLVNGDFEADALTPGPFPNEIVILTTGGFVPAVPISGWDSAFVDPAGGGLSITNGSTGGGLFQAVNHTPGLISGTDPQASLKMFGFGGMWQDVPAAPGDVLDFSFWAASVASDPIASPSIGFMFIDFLDAADATLANASGGTAGNSDSTNPITDFDDIDEFSADWIQFTGTTDPAPAGTTTARVFILTQEFGGAHFFDDFVVELASAPSLPGDANGDGTVDLLDFDILAQNFGATSPAAVPEPASLGLLGLGAAALLRRRRA
ncbi:MAG: PEP-CTERM sorting domain-containing protein [Planctomycetota bacterium]